MKMKSKDEFKKTGIKNCTCYYFDHIMRDWDINIDTDFSSILLDEKLYKEKNESILIYGISYKTSKDVKPLRIRYDKIDEFIKILNKIRYSILLDERCDKKFG